MKKYAIALALAAAASSVEAGPFRRKATCSSGNCTVAATTTVTRTTVTVTELSSAQGAANYIARTNLFRHHGGHRSFEGIGMGASPDAAIAACCKPRFGGAPREIGIARMANGLFVAVCRW